MSRRPILLAAGVAATLLAGIPAMAHADVPAPTTLIHDGLASIDNTAQFAATTAPYPPYQHDTTVEPSIAVNPKNPLNAVAAFHEGRDATGSAADIGFATTTDGGATWTSGNLPHLTQTVDPNQTLNHASDPVVAWGDNNVVYVSSLVTTEEGGNPTVAGLALSTSKDGGLTWEAPIVMHYGNPQVLSETHMPYDDKNWVTVDWGTGPGHHFGRVYVVWDIQFQMLYAYCDPDNTSPLGAGAPGCDLAGNWTTFAGNQEAFYTFYNGPGIGSYPLVLKNGNLEIVFTNDTGNFVEVTSQTPAGSQAWPQPIVFGAPTTIAADDATSVRLQRAGPDLPTAAVDPLTGRVAVGWAGSTQRGDGLNDPEVAISTDNTGQTFGSPIRVDHGAPTNDQVNRYNVMLDWGPTGDLRVAYRQRQEAAQPIDMSNVIDTYYQVSYDSGSTWSTPLKVDTQPTDVGYCAFSRNGCFLGDYNQLAAAGANTYIVRAEAYASYPNEPYNNAASGSTPPCFCADNGHEHQSMWVAVVGPAAPANTPESPAGAALVAAGAVGALVVVVGRRRRHGELES